MALFERDGQVYVAMAGAVIRVDQDGIIHHLAGGEGAIANVEDSVPFGSDARKVRLRTITDMTPGSPGIFYLTVQLSSSSRTTRNGKDIPLHAIVALYENEDSVAYRRLTGSRFMNGIAPSGSALPDPMPTSEYLPISPRGLSFRDGKLYLTASQGLFEMEPFGQTRLLSGSVYYNVTGSHKETLETSRWAFPESVVASANGTMTVSDPFNNILTQISPDGRVKIIAGGGERLATSSGMAAREAALSFPSKVAVTADGKTQYFTSGNRVFKVRTAPLGEDEQETKIPRAGGAVFDVFDEEGYAIRVENTQGDPLLTYRYLDYTLPDGGTARWLSEITNAHGSSVTLERDGLGAPLRIVSPAPFSHTTDLILDGEGYLESATWVGTNPAETVRFTYGQATDEQGGLLLSKTDPKGRTYLFEYDDKGRVEKTFEPTEEGQPEPALEIGRQESGVPTQQRVEVTVRSAEELETVQTTTLHRAGALAGTLDEQILAPNGVVQRTFITPKGEVVTQTPLTTSRVETIEDTRFRNGQVRRRSKTTIENGARLEEITTERTTLLADPDDPQSIFSTCQTATTTDGQSDETCFTTGPYRCTQTRSDGRQEIVDLDAQLRPIQQSLADPAAHPVILYYDALGRLERQEHGDSGDPATLRQTTYDFDPSSGYTSTITSRIDAGRDAVGTFTYDAAGRVASFSSAVGETVGYGYDLNGNVTVVSPPGRPDHLFDYNAVNLQNLYQPPALGTDPESGYIRTFNKDHQPVAVTDPDGRTSTMQYNRQTGQPLRLILPREAHEYAFDPETAQLTSIATRAAGSIVASLDYEYEGPLLVRETWTGEVAGSVEYDFAPTSFRRDAIAVRDTQGGFHRLATDATQPLDPVLILDGTYTLRRHHSATRGLLESMVLDDRVTDTFTHNGFGQWESVTIDHVGTGQRYRVVLDYDGLGRIREKQEILFGSENRRYGYEYDDSGRLIEVLDLDTNQPIAEYQYDVNGQRIAWSDAFGSGTPTDVEYDAQDRLLRRGDVTYTYNKTGQRVTKTQNGQTVTYDYDQGGQLRRVDMPDGLVIEYLYDAQGRRLGKKVNGVLVQGFLYGDALGPIAELDGDGRIKCFFLYGLHAYVPDAMLCGGQLYNVVKDPLGHVRLIDNVDTGQVVQRLDYDPFGRVMLDTNPGFQPFGWAGGLYERQTGLIRFGVRDYDPEIGRWTAKDPLDFGGGDSNLYAYAGNDPINAIDPTGEIAWIPLIIGGYAIYDAVDSFLGWKDAVEVMGREGFSRETVDAVVFASVLVVLGVVDGPSNIADDAVQGMVKRTNLVGGVGGKLDDAVNLARREIRRGIGVPSGASGRNKRCRIIARRCQRADS